MNDLKVFEHNGQKVVDSRIVAEQIEIQHKDLLKKVRNYEEILLGAKLRSVDFFVPHHYTDSTGRSLNCYLLTKQGCEMVANKLTGEKGVLFTAQYVKAFNAMQEELKNPRIDSVKAKEVEARYMNAKARMARLWMKLGESVPTQDKEYKMICNAYASEVLTGQKVLPFPESTEKYYTAKEVGEMLGGVSPNQIGRIANKYELKNEVNGKWFFDKSQHSNKEVQTYKYNKQGIEEIKKALNGEAK